MKVLCNTINKVALDSKCYSGVEFSGNDYSNFIAEFGLSSYGWDNVRSRKRVTIDFSINKDTDLSKYRNIVGLSKILSRLKVLCEKGVLMYSNGNVLVYPVSSSKAFISVISISSRFAY